MADSKITALTAISTVDPTADPLVIVDVSDTSMAASGTTKKSTINQLLGSGGTATLASATITGAATVGTTLGVTGASTLASATITGDLTVRTNKLLVTATGVGVGAVSVNPFDVTSTSGTLSVFKRTGSNGAFIGIQDGSGGLAYLGYTNGVFSIQTSGSGYSDKYTITTDGTATWYVAGTTAMTLNSTGLTVSTGTTNPLDLTNAAVTTERQIKIENSTVTAYLGVEPAAGGRFIGSAAGNAYFGTNVAYGLEFATNNNVRMTLNTTGNLAFKSGLGIDFSAVTGGTGTATANVLNDYEEGTWVPVLGGSGGTSGQTYSLQVGRYTKVGRQVVCNFEVTLTAVGTVTTYAVISGLPFTSSATSVNLDGGSASIGFANNLATNQIFITGYVPGSDTKCWISSTAAAGTAIGNITATNIWGNTTRIAGSITYTAA